MAEPFKQIPGPGRSRDREAWITYVVASLPGWAAAAALGIVAPHVTDLPGWLAALVVLAWIGLGVALFPSRRHYYTPEPAAERMLGRTGASVSVLSPRGVVRVRGELWKAIAADPDETIPAGAGVRVCGIRGLELVVEHHTRPAGQQRR
jgi:membrane protein implicated in regulation of membrane protease activity